MSELLYKIGRWCLHWSIRKSPWKAVFIMLETERWVYEKLTPEQIGIGKQMYEDYQRRGGNQR